VTRVPGLAVAVLLIGSAVHADPAACEKIRVAYTNTERNGVKMQVTGYAFAKDTPQLYALGDQTCTYLRDETMEGQPTAVYREQYKSDKGSTDATIWISKASGRLVREEQDGDITGKGKGHISYRWPGTPK
jgi:hypothetical protein